MTFLYVPINYRVVGNLKKCYWLSMLSNNVWGEGILVLQTFISGWNVSCFFFILVLFLKSFVIWIFKMDVYICHFFEVREMMLLTYILKSVTSLLHNHLIFNNILYSWLTRWTSPIKLEMIKVSVSFVVAGAAKLIFSEPLYFLTALSKKKYFIHW